MAQDHWFIIAEMNDIINIVKNSDRIIPVNQPRFLYRKVNT